MEFDPAQFADHLVSGMSDEADDRHRPPSCGDGPTPLGGYFAQLLRRSSVVGPQESTRRSHSSARTRIPRGTCGEYRQKTLQCRERRSWASFSSIRVRTDLFLSPKIRFAIDSPLEESGFELMVPPRQRNGNGRAPAPTSIILREDAPLGGASWPLQSRIGYETAPNRLSHLLPHRNFQLGKGLSCAEPEVRNHLPPWRSHEAAETG